MGRWWRRKRSAKERKWWTASWLLRMKKHKSTDNVSLANHVLLATRRIHVNALSAWTTTVHGQYQTGMLQQNIFPFKTCDTNTHDYPMFLCALGLEMFCSSNDWFFFSCSQLVSDTHSFSNTIFSMAPKCLVLGQHRLYNLISRLSGHIYREGQLSNQYLRIKLCPLGK